MSETPIPANPAAARPLADRLALERLGAAVRARLAGDPAAYRIPVDKAEVYAAADFLTPGECARFIALVDAVAVPSPTFDQQIYGAYRTSFSGDVDPADPFVRMIGRRIDDMLGIDPRFGEPIQGQRYTSGQEFKGHHDWFYTDADYWPEEAARGGQRSWTAMIYLAEVEAGGETLFDYLGLSIPPQQGALLTWNNAQPSGAPNEATRHAATPVVAGVKYVITKWYRTRVWG